MKATRSLALLATLGTIALIAGCSGGFAPTLPSPVGEGLPVGQYQTTVTPGGAGLTPAELPDTLTAANFTVTLDGEPTRVVSARRAVTGPLFICFILDTTGSMEQEIAGVVNSIEAFADSFAGRPITWAGVEYGDATPLDGITSWDVFLENGDAPRARTKCDPTTSLATLKAWLQTLVAIGGGDGPENPLDAMMETKRAAPNGYGWSFPALAPRHYIVITDVGAHERADGIGGYPEPGTPNPICDYSGAEVLAAFRGWAFVHCVSPDYSGDWAEPAAAKNNKNGGPDTEVYVSGKGWDVRELADGGPAAARTHHGTGGVWAEMPDDGNVNLAALHISSIAQESYVVTYIKPTGMTTADIKIEAAWIGGDATWEFDDYVF